MFYESRTCSDISQNMISPSEFIKQSLMRTSPEGKNTSRGHDCSVKYTHTHACVTLTHSPSSSHSSGGLAFFASRGSSHDVVLVLWLKRTEKTLCCSLATIIWIWSVSLRQMLVQDSLSNVKHSQLCIPEGLSHSWVFPVTAMTIDILNKSLVSH